MMAGKPKKASTSPSLAEILEKRDPELRESFFKSETSDVGRGDNLKNAVSTFAQNVLFKTKKSTAIVVAAITFVLTLSFSSLFAPPCALQAVPQCLLTSALKAHPAGRLMRSTLTGHCPCQIGRAHVLTPVTLESRMPSSA